MNERCYGHGRTPPQDAAAAEQRKYVETLSVSGSSLLSLLNDILDLSKVEAGKVDFEPAPLDVRQAIGETLAILSARVKQKGLSLRCEVTRDVPHILMGDSNRLRQVLVNLVGNAIKFTGSGEVGVRAGVEESSGDNCTVHFEVWDTGIGIPAEAQALIFDPFHQADGSIRAPVRRHRPRTRDLRAPDRPHGWAHLGRERIRAGQPFPFHGMLRHSRRG